LSASAPDSRRRMKAVAGLMPPKTAAVGELRGAMTVGKKAIMADAVKAVGEGGALEIREKSGSQGTLRWRGESAANSSLKSQNSLLAGKIQGISSIRASAARQQRPKRASNQYLTGQFPTHPNREFFAALQGIESDHQGNFRRDQGIPASSAFWQLPADKSYRPDISNVAEKANRDAARCSKSPKPSRSRGRLCPCERRSRYAADRSPSSSTRNDRRSGASRWRVVASRAAQVHRAHRNGGPRVRIHLSPARSQLRTRLTSRPERKASNWHRLRARY
jgi:hypothetical protein